MKKIIAAILLIVSVGIFIFAGYQLIAIKSEYDNGKNNYNEIRDQIKQTVSADSEKQSTASDNTNTENKNNNTKAFIHEKSGKLTMLSVEIDYLLAKNYEFDFDQLFQMNEQAKGWIWINDTNIDYPLVQGDDNEYYIRRTVERKDNNAGSIFLDARLTNPFVQENTIIYGHNQKNRQMFHDLTYFMEEDYWKNHRYIQVVTPDYEYLYQIFSCYQTDEQSKTYRYLFSSKEEYQNYLDWCVKQSFFEIPVEISANNQIVTLSTCTNETEEGRYIVQAKLIQKREYSR